MNDNNLEYQDSYFGLTCMFVEHFALLVEANRIFDKKLLLAGVHNAQNMWILRTMLQRLAISSGVATVLRDAVVYSYS